MALTLVLTLALPAQAQPVYRGADGGVELVDVERALLLTPAGDELGVDRGAWLSDESLLQAAREHAELAERNRYLEAHAGDVPYRWLLGTAVVCVVLGAAAGFVVARQLPR